MGLKSVFGFAVALLLTIGTAQAKPMAQLSDAQVKQQIIEESIDSYSGNCACPFNTASNGSRCGKRSAWSRPAGASPICYANEITVEMIKAWREEHGDS